MDRISESLIEGFIIVERWTSIYVYIYLSSLVIAECCLLCVSCLTTFLRRITGSLLSPSLHMYGIFLMWLIFMPNIYVSRELRALISVPALACWLWWDWNSQLSEQTSLVITAELPWVANWPLCNFTKQLNMLGGVGNAQFGMLYSTLNIIGLSLTYIVLAVDW